MPFSSVSELSNKIPMLISLLSSLLQAYYDS
jgi:hypothetical protein